MSALKGRELEGGRETRTLDRRKPDYRAFIHHSNPALYPSPKPASQKSDHNLSPIRKGGDPRDCPLHSESSLLSLLRKHKPQGSQFWPELMCCCCCLSVPLDSHFPSQICFFHAFNSYVLKVLLKNEEFCDHLSSLGTTGVFFPGSVYSFFF